MKLTLRLVALLQGVYFFVPGIWPLLHMPSFLAVTGPKTDLWLVKTVGALLAVIGLALMAAGIKKRVTPEIMLLGVLAAVAMAVVDIYYSGTNTISDIYRYDAACEIIIIFLWVIAWNKSKNKGK